MKAVWNGTIIAESDDAILFDNNRYFPSESIKQAHFKTASMTTVCPWKGTAHYHDVIVDGKTNAGAAWHYPHPKPAAEAIKGRVAFWKGVAISD